MLWPHIVLLLQTVLYIFNAEKIPYIVNVDEDLLAFAWKVFLPSHNYKQIYIKDKQVFIKISYGNS